MKPVLARMSLVTFMVIPYLLWSTGALAADVSDILRDLLQERAPTPFRQQASPRERSVEERRASWLAREIIEGRIPQEIRDKYGITEVSYDPRQRGRVIGHDLLELPPFSRARVTLRTYCLDRPLPAPASGEKLHLIDVSKLLLREFIPIYERLMSYSALHPEKNLQLQRIVWVMRFLSEGMYVPSFDLVPEDRSLLEEIYPGSVWVIENQKRRLLLKREVSKLFDVLLNQTLPPEVRGVLRELSRWGYDVNKPPRDLRTADEIVSKTLQIINAMQPTGAIVEDYSEYTLLSDDIAVKTEHPGGASRTLLTVANPTPAVKTMDFKRYALQSGRDTQRLGIGGIDSVEWPKGGDKIAPPFCIPTKGSLGYRYKEKSHYSEKPHSGIDIWTGYYPNDVNPPGNPIYLPYEGTLIGFETGKSDEVVQGLRFKHKIDESFKDAVPELEVETVYLHMANQETGDSYVNEDLLRNKEVIGKSFPKGFLLGYQGNRKWDQESNESVITHLHFTIRYNAAHQDPSPYLGFPLNIEESPLNKGFQFTDEHVCIPASIKEGDDLIKSLKELKEAMLQKIDIDIDNTAQAFTNVKDYWQWKRWADIASPSLRVLQALLSILAKATNRESLAKQTDLALDSTESVADVIGIGMAIHGVYESGGKLYWGVYGPPYISSVEAMLKAADATTVVQGTPIGFSPEHYKRAIKNHLDGVADNTPLIIPRKSSQPPKERTVEVIKGALQLKKRINKSFNDLIAEIKSKQLPSNFPIDEVVTQINELKTYIAKSLLYTTKIEYTTYYDQRLREEQTTLGAPGSFYRAFGNVAGRINEKLKTEQRAELIRLIGSGANIVVLLKIPGFEDIEVIQRVATIGDIIIKGTSRLYYKNVEEDFYMLPQEMLFSLPVEFSNLLMIADDTINYLSSLLRSPEISRSSLPAKPRPAEVPAPPPPAATPVPQRVEVSVATAIIRGDPSEEAAVMGTVVKGTTLDKTGQAGNWVKVRLPWGPEGWVHSSQVKESVPVVE